MFVTKMSTFLTMTGYFELRSESMKAVRKNASKASRINYVDQCQKIQSDVTLSHNCSALWLQTDLQCGTPTCTMYYTSSRGAAPVRAPVHGLNHGPCALNSTGKFGQPGGLNSHIE